MATLCRNASLAIGVRSQRSKKITKQVAAYLVSVNAKRRANLHSNRKFVSKRNPKRNRQLLHDNLVFTCNYCNVRARSPDLWRLLRVPPERKDVVACRYFWDLHLVYDAPTKSLSCCFVDRAVVLVQLAM